MRYFNRSFISVALLCLFACATSSCSKTMSFDEEYDLSLRAGIGDLSDEEKADLLKKNHPILMQMGDPSTRALIEGFANLPASLHNEIKEKTYLKWKYSDLDSSRQKPFLVLVEANLAIAKQQGMPPNPGFSVEALNRAEVGYAIVEINPSKEMKVVSLFILWPELPSPTWVTVVNGKLAGTQEYFQAHLQRLPMLGSMNTSTLP